MPSESLSPISRNARVLCVDDEPAIREVLRALLSRDGFEVDAVEDGYDALRLLQESPGRYHVLITDNEMPSLAGKRLVQMVREAKLPVKIIVFSALGSPEDEQAFRRCNVDALVPKGAPIDELLREVRRVAASARG